MARRFRVPHTLVLLFSMIVLAWALTFVLPQGSFARVDDHGHEQVVPGSYTPATERTVLAPWDLFKAVPRGLAAAGDIIFFVFLVGGTIGVLRKTGAIDALISLLLQAFGKRPFYLIAGGVFLFALGSSTIGMAEEYLPFVAVLVALSIGLGFDAMTAIGILCVGYGIGYGVATINPFTIMIAQDVAGLVPTSGAGFRLLIAIPFLAVGIHHVWRYASRVHKDPTQSLVADVETDPSLSERKETPFSIRHGLILFATALAIGILVWGLRDPKLGGPGWYLEEMGAMFLALTVVLAIIGRVSADTTARSFCEGAAELTTTALLIGFARGILLMLEDGHVIDTIVNAIAAPLSVVPTQIAAFGMLVFQSLCNLFIPSGSGQAYVTMPIMSPLADLLGIQRQVAVLAYQFGDGFTNILVPTNAVLMGILGLGRIPYDRWLRFILPFMVKIWLLAAVILAIAVGIGYS